MEVYEQEPVHGTDADELRIGIASWDEKKKGGAGEQLSMKYTWPDKNGKPARGGEVPLAAIPQVIEFAIRTGYMKPADVLEAVVRALRSKAS
jgi:hypothetical protein